MIFNEIILHTSCIISHYNYNFHIIDSELSCKIVNVSRFVSNLLIQTTFYPIIINTINLFCTSKECKDLLAVSLLICYAIVFTTDSLVALFYYFIYIEFMACSTVSIAMIRIYYVINEIKKKSLGNENYNISGMVDEIKSNLNRGIIFSSFYILICFILSVRSLYFIYFTVNYHSDYYYNGTLKETMSFASIYDYIGSVGFVCIYGISLIIWTFNDRFCHCTFSAKLDSIQDNVNNNHDDDIDAKMTELSIYQTETIGIDIKQVEFHSDES